MDRTIIFLHGYGVRGWFWDDFAQLFTSANGGGFDRILTPDLNMTDIDTLFETTTRLVADEAKKQGPVYLVGHSLGGAVAAVVTGRLGEQAVAGIACIATPFGGNRSSGKSLTRFLIKHRMIPQFVARPRFFGTTPLAVQKAMFAKVSPESPALADAIMADTYSHTKLLSRALSIPAIVVCSEADRIVPVSQCRQLSAQLGADIYVFERARRIGHDDFVGAPPTASEVRTIISNFFARGSHA
ncbi:MAG TPA: alpha/beta hydrolase [Spirochaetia bacterium]|nr:alpha/beta hydrolase [Spirochaetia bacterium]